ncbi:hypothetical protein O3P69_013009 [Scylla paramamosain]|uniref:LIM zinc-binding domain-containing protein n=1 Tax=Scylla paramamosain TaxID=85552 RepID=A0AAW0TQW0_SCYPA
MQWITYELKLKMEHTSKANAQEVSTLVISQPICHPSLNTYGEAQLKLLKVFCYTCKKQVEGAEVLTHLFFGTIKCKNCYEVLNTCIVFKKQFPVTSNCYASKDGHCLVWKELPVAYVMQNIRTDMSKKSTTILTAHEVAASASTYVHTIMPLRELDPWRTAMSYMIENPLLLNLKDLPPPIQPCRITRQQISSKQQMAQPKSDPVTRQVLPLEKGQKRSQESMPPAKRRNVPHAPAVAEAITPDKTEATPATEETKPRRHASCAALRVIRTLLTKSIKTETPSSKTTLVPNTSLAQCQSTSASLGSRETNISAARSEMHTAPARNDANTSPAKTDTNICPATTDTHSFPARVDPHTCPVKSSTLPDGMCTSNTTKLNSPCKEMKHVSSVTSKANAQEVSTLVISQPICHPSLNTYGEAQLKLLKVFCYTCKKQVEGAKVLTHLFFGTIKCKNCYEVLNTCNVFKKQFPVTSNCYASKDGHCLVWKELPVAYVMQNIRTDMSKKSTTILTAHEVAASASTYVHTIMPLRELDPWRTAMSYMIENPLLLNLKDLPPPIQPCRITRRQISSKQQMAQPKSDPVTRQVLPLEKGQKRSQESMPPAKRRNMPHAPAVAEAITPDKTEATPATEETKPRRHASCAALKIIQALRVKSIKTETPSSQMTFAPKTSLALSQLTSASPPTPSDEITVITSPHQASIIDKGMSCAFRPGPKSTNNEHTFQTLPKEDLQVPPRPQYIPAEVFATGHYLEVKWKKGTPKECPNCYCKNFVNRSIFLSSSVVKMVCQECELYIYIHPHPDRFILFLAEKYKKALPRCINVNTYKMEPVQLGPRD